MRTGCGWLLNEDFRRSARRMWRRRLASGRRRLRSGSRLARRRRKANSSQRLNGASVLWVRTLSTKWRFSSGRWGWSWWRCFRRWFGFLRPLRWPRWCSFFFLLRCMARPSATPKGEALPAPPDFFWPLAAIASRHGMSTDALVRASQRGELTLTRSGRAFTVSDTEYRRWLTASQSRPALSFSK